MPVFDLFSIGHSNIPAERFVALLRGAGVTAIADLRSTPYSRFFPWYSAKSLATRLAAADMTYTGYGERLGGRPRSPALYCNGIADYEAMARQPAYRTGIDQVLNEAAQHRVCLLCAEREPLDCHRCLLVTRTLAERGLGVGHILYDGTIEPHEVTEQRLLSLCGESDDLFLTGQEARLAAAYRRRGRAVAYRVKAKGRIP